VNFQCPSPPLDKKQSENQLGNHPPCLDSQQITHVGTLCPQALSAGCRCQVPVEVESKHE